HAVFGCATHAPMDAQPLLLNPLSDESAFVRGFAEQGLWLLWTRSGDAGIDAQMAKATEAMQGGQYPDGIAVLTDVIRRKPGFAEGWNRRATVYYLAGELQKSIADCDEVLKRKPGISGSLSGMGQIYLQLDDEESALKWFRRALEVNPNMLSVEMNIKMLEER